MRPFLVPVLLACLATLLVAAPLSEARLPRGFAGVLADGPAIDGTVSFEAQARAMQRNGVAWIRLPVYWRDVEPARGDLRLGALDAQVGAAARAGLPVMPVVLVAPAWAAKKPGNFNSHPARVSDYAGFVAALARRYGRGGTYWNENAGPDLPISRWQIWNEPDLEPYWDQEEPGWQNTYLPLLRAAGTAIREVDPSAQVVLAGLSNFSWTSLSRLYRAGARGSFDIAAINPFSREVSGVMEIVRRYREVMKTNREASKRLILSEVAWSSGKGMARQQFGWETTEKGQASRLSALFRALAGKRRAYRIDSVAWATWLSPPLGSPDSFAYSGLNRMSGGRVVAKPALAAFRRSVAPPPPR